MELGGFEMYQDGPEYLELIVHHKERHSRGLRVSAVEKGDVAALPVHLREVDQCRVQSYTRTWNRNQTSS